MTWSFIGKKSSSHEEMQDTNIQMRQLQNATRSDNKIKFTADKYIIKSHKKGWITIIREDLIYGSSDRRSFWRINVSLIQHVRTFLLSLITFENMIIGSSSLMQWNNFENMHSTVKIIIFVSFLARMVMNRNFGRFVGKFRNESIRESTHSNRLCW